MVLCEYPLFSILICYLISSRGTRQFVGDTLAQHPGFVGDTLAQHPGFVGDTLAQHPGFVGDTLGSMFREDFAQVQALSK